MRHCADDAVHFTPAHGTTDGGLRANACPPVGHRFAARRGRPAVAGTGYALGALVHRLMTTGFEAPGVQ
jgi:hypothetical protein